MLCLKKKKEKNSEKKSFCHLFIYLVFKIWGRINGRTFTISIMVEEMDTQNRAESSKVLCLISDKIHNIIQTKQTLHCTCRAQCVLLRNCCSLMAEHYLVSVLCMERIYSTLNFREHKLYLRKLFF